MEVSNPDRVVFPEDGITKGDVVDYYVRVADRMLPFIEGRLLSVERFPRGIEGQGFMQKNVPDHAPEELIGRHEVPKEGGGTTVYPMVDSVEGIAFFANLGVITFHVPPVRAEDEEHPDWVIWDLDPPADSVELVREAAREMRAVLETFGIETVLMTSGSKGYHLRALLRANHPCRGRRTRRQRHCCSRRRRQRRPLDAGISQSRSRRSGLRRLDEEHITIHFGRSLVTPTKGRGAGRDPDLMAGVG